MKSRCFYRFGIYQVSAFNSKLTFMVSHRGTSFPAWYIHNYFQPKQPPLPCCRAAEKYPNNGSLKASKICTAEVT